jgi:hypothetical protein
VFLRLLASLLIVTATAIPARGQAFQAGILDAPHGLDNAEGTGISRAGVATGYGWENGDAQSLTPAAGAGRGHSRHQARPPDPSGVGSRGRPGAREEGIGWHLASSAGCSTST